MSGFINEVAKGATEVINKEVSKELADSLGFNEYSKYMDYSNAVLDNQEISENQIENRNNSEVEQNVNSDISKQIDYSNSKADLIENTEMNEFHGGSYKELKEKGHGDYSEPPQEVHHMPADSISKLDRNDGPAIAMDKVDHRQTASCGSSLEAREYRAEQKKLIDSGNFEAALQMDIDDLHEKFGEKYDEAIVEMKDYYYTIGEKING